MTSLGSRAPEGLSEPPNVALAHDYLTQRGGAERVVLSLTRAFPEASLHTSLYEPAMTFPEFGVVDVRPGPLNRITPFRRDHRLALPLLALAFSRSQIDAEVLICSSSGWSHGARTRGRKIVYCHTPARWLYQTGRYLRGRGASASAAAAVLRAPLLCWDRAAARTADRYLANSSVVADRIGEAYGVDADVLPPPPALTPGGACEPVAALTPGFVLCVSRLLPYKNVDVVVRAFAAMPDEQLVIAGTGPDEALLRTLASRNVTFAGRVTDDQLRWLYESCDLLVSASHEDFGLTPLEAATFGKPSVVLRWGGFLDTVKEGETGLFFDELNGAVIAAAIRDAGKHAWNAGAIRAHADLFSEARFIERIRAVVAEAA